MSTLAQMRTQIQARGYGTDTATTQTELLNSAYREVCGDHHWEWLIENAAATAMTPGVALVSGMPADVVHIRTLTFSFGTTEEFFPEFLPFQEFLRIGTEGGYDLASATRGSPQWWTIRGWLSGAPEIIVLPYPDRAYVPALTYVKDPPELSADGDIPVLPVTYHDILVYGALAEMAARNRDWAQSDRWRARYERTLGRMRAQEGIGPQQNSAQVVKSGFFADPARWPEW